MATELIRTYCAQCKARCGVVCRVEDGRLVAVEEDRDHPNGGICVKGRAAPEIVSSPDRLRYPMVRTTPKHAASPSWRRVTWDEALDLAATRLLELRARYGAESVVLSRPSPAGSSSIDYSAWLTRLGNAFGSPNQTATVHICNWHKDAGSRYTYGVGLPVPEFEQSGCVLLWGWNPAVSWVVNARRVGRARRRGARLIVVDPRRTTHAAEADLWLAVRPGADGALALSLAHVILEEELFDSAFVRRWTNATLLLGPAGRLIEWRELGRGEEPGFVAWDAATGQPVRYDVASRTFVGASDRPSLAGPGSLQPAAGELLPCHTVFEALKTRVGEFAPERMGPAIWVQPGQIRQAARLMAGARPVSYFSYAGIEQHSNAILTNRAICVLYGLTGDFDRPGGNVIYPAFPAARLEGSDLLAPEQARKRLGLEKRPLGPPATMASVHGYDVYDAILTGSPYPVRGMVSFGGNLLLSHGAPEKGARALQALEFFLYVDFFENPGMRFADVVLPATTCWEAEALHVKNTSEVTPGSYNHVQLRQQVVPPQHEARPDTEIIFALAQRLGLGHLFWEGDRERAFEALLAPSGITLAELRKAPGGITVPLPVRYEKHRQVDGRTGQLQGFPTPTGLLELYSTTFARHGLDPLPRFEEPAESPARAPELAACYPLILISGKSPYFCHSRHRNIPMLRRHEPEPVAEIHPETAARHGIADTAWILVESPMGSVRVRASVTPRIAPGVVSIAAGWWQPCGGLDLSGYDPVGMDGANVNMLIGEAGLDPISGSIPQRSGACRVRPLIRG